MEQTQLAGEKHDLSFLAEKAADEGYVFSAQQQGALALVAQSLHAADTLLIRLGGKAGRLGECVVASALLEGVLQALLYLRHTIPVCVEIDAGSVSLFPSQLYQQRYWQTISIVSVETTSTFDPLQVLSESAVSRVLMLDFHGGHDGKPYAQRDTLEREGRRYTCVSLANLFRIGIRNYAQRGAFNRYADFVIELFSLPEGAIEGRNVQPTLYLSAQERASYAQLLKSFRLGSPDFSIVCFFQSVVLAKCYERWDEVMGLLCADYAAHRPGQMIDFIVACGPDEQQPMGFKKVDIQEWFEDFSAAHRNARIHVISIISLRELAIITSQARLVLSNDTGPAHIAGALHVPVVIPYLPGNLYSLAVWSSSLWHHSVTLDQHSYSYRELESAIVWGKTEIIDSISPQLLYEQVRSVLVPSLLAGG
jgi:hypothetical protein